MIQTKIFQSSAFRLAIVFSGLFFVTFIIAGFLAYQIILGDLRDRLDESLKQTFDLISRSYAGNDLEDLTATVQSYAVAAEEHDRVFFLADAAGQKLAGNVEKADVSPGLASVSEADFGFGLSDSYRSFRGTFDGHLLVVGASFSEIEELGGLALTSFLWAGGLASLIAIIAGALLATAVQKRMQAIASTMAQVGRGDLNARIPLRRNGDDVDILAGQVNAALDRLASLVESVRQVSVDIAHDLKTPLNRLAIIIEGALELAANGEDNTVDLMQAQEEAVQINATFEALLRIAQLESGSRRERFAPVQLADILEVLVEAYVDVAADSQQVLSLVRRAVPIPMILGDKDLLTQLFANLIENAIRHAGAGSRIELSLVKMGDSIAVGVGDDGPGIPEAERTRVFQRLYRLSKSRTTPGSGLGLSMVKAIADLHGAGIALGDRSPGLQVTILFEPMILEAK
ncbi:ATP-binding protein [Devosia sp.]|uniref:HAMP domain-containing sensor histidine kinase n=1 Tax=Devosia sp. TaxID=1871048 RepID=UPI003266CA47